METKQSHQQIKTFSSKVLFQKGVFQLNFASAVSPGTLLVLLVSESMSRLRKSPQYHGNQTQWLTNKVLLKLSD